ncbi:MAG: hypothetical protein P4L50_19615 [Anaerolineaceae bacterium]|nr:hypothetical protein [Anaerolineaceae bacterium]
MLRKFKILLIALVILVIAGGAYGFAAANNVDASAAGYSATVVSGYDITNIKYNLNSDTPTLVDTITFTATPHDMSAPVVALVKVQTATDGTWKDCTFGDPVDKAMPVTCTYTDPTLTIASVTALNIVASSSTSGS